MKPFMIAHTCAMACFVMVFSGCDSDNTPRTEEPPTNSPPTADAGPDQTNGVFVGGVVFLDGSGSSDPDNDTINYLWALEMAPAGSAATLSDATTSSPSFDVDFPGDYAALLIVYDGEHSSSPDPVSITALIPPPTVTIDSPDDGFIVDTSPVMVTGTVTGLDVSITVNGEMVPHTDGTFSVNVALQEGDNTITAIATNSTDEARADINVALNTTDAPALTLTSPKRDFLRGKEFDKGSILSRADVTVSGRIKVNTTLGFPANRPIVEVNGEPVEATLTPLRCGLTLNLAQCWSFSTSTALERGDRTITVIATDRASLPRSSIRTIGGTIDYCRKVWTNGRLPPDVLESGVDDVDLGISALAGNNAILLNNNRCHEIDGCSVPRGCTFDNNPMPLAVCNIAPTDFGSGGGPPDEFFIHGLSSKDDLPCNKHDVCYQTCITPAGQEATREDMRFCNVEMHEDMKEVCQRAYPTVICPIKNLPTACLAAGACLTYQKERAQCFNRARGYFLGLAFGFDKFELRQANYCAE